MKTGSDNLQGISRRRFSKSIIASLMAAPLVSSLSSCKAKREPLPSIKRCEGNVSDFPHEPPIGVSDGGSLIIEVPEHNKILTPVQNVPGDARPFKHILGTANFTSIQEVRALKRPKSQRPSFVIYSLLPDPKFQLRIWLAHLSINSGTLEDQYESVPDGTEPHLILKPTSPQIETQGQLQDATNVVMSHKTSVPYRYQYPQAADERHFRIGKWQITDDKGTVVQDADGNLFQSDTDSDSYELFVSFNHPE
jgi:hypothetical protein